MENIIRELSRCSWQLAAMTSVSFKAASLTLSVDSTRLLEAHFLMMQLEASLKPMKLKED